jgi:hypothetical protein
MFTSFRCSTAAVAAVLAAIVAGCGGGAEDSPPRVLDGDGFSFAAPAGWKVTRKEQEIAASDGDTSLVSVQVFRLTKPFRPTLFQAAATELDGVAARLAQGLGGRVERSGTVTVAGRRARQYALSYHGLVQEVTFVLDGRREYQLLCRRKSESDPEEACTSLVRTFRLA